MDIRRIGTIILRGQQGLDDTADLFLSETPSEECREALEIYTTESRRIYMEAALLATTDYGRIAEIFEFKIPVIEMYEKAFFPAKSMSRLDKLWHVDGCKESYEQNLKRWAFTQGIEFLAWRLGMRVELLPVEVVTTLQADCFFKAKEAFFNHNSTDASKEAIKWTRLATDLSRVVKAWVSNNKEAMQDIELALQTLNASDVDFGDIKEVREENGDAPESNLSDVDVDFGDINDIMRQNDND